MAHADYDCCAICDDKISYSGFATPATKEDICTKCRRLLQNRNINVVDKEQLLEWIKNTPDAKKIPTDIGYQKCYYKNDVDEALREEK